MKIDVKKVAKLANLTITETEEKKLEKHLSEILAYFEQLKKVDAAKVESTSQVTGLENVLRGDEAEESLSQDDALSGNKVQHNGFFKVKAVLEND